MTERDKVAQNVQQCLDKIRLFRVDEETKRIKSELNADADPERRAALMKQLVQLTYERNKLTDKA